jgi:pimeloyl-ACP methyl ester carboxylesterase
MTKIALASGVALVALAAPLQGQQRAAWKDPSSHVIRFVPVGQEVRLEVLDWGDDVLAVLDALALQKLVLVGHSIAGQELSSVAARFPQRVAALVYLDAGYPYAFDNERIPTFGEIAKIPFPQPPPPGDADLIDFEALRRYETRVLGFAYPEANLRTTYGVTPDGRVGPPLAPPGGTSLLKTITKFPQIPAPALFVVSSQDPGVWTDANTDPTIAEQMAALNGFLERQAKAIQEGVPGARVVKLARANHYVYLSNEEDVLREMRTFLAGVR